MKISTILFILIVSFELMAQNCKEDSPKVISLDKFSDGIHHWNLFNRHDYYYRYKDYEINAIANNLLEYQNKDGGWPKNIDWVARIDIDSLKGTLNERKKSSTLDNNNIFPQIEYQAKVYQITGDEKYRSSAERGLDYVLSLQHQSGGWRGGDVDAVTYNDQVMTGVMNLFLDVIELPEHYNWLDSFRINEIKVALKKAIDVTLNCQIVVDGEKTAWCQQHDHFTFKPVKARSYELPSITAWESTDIIQVLMRIKNPNDSIIDAINKAIVWLEKSRISGVRLEKIDIPKEAIINEQYKYDLIFVEDSLEYGLWARYYEINTNQPFLCRRDGTKVYCLSEVDPERRTGYKWYGNWPRVVIEEEYPKWKKSLQK